uniref:Citrate transporter-like domain-containing protein n=1 Tax=Alexandrium monilatum TaxID=311494 RepID=A0A7S4SLB3_9DINO
MLEESGRQAENGEVELQPSGGADYQGVRPRTIGARLEDIGIDDVSTDGNRAQLSRSGTGAREPYTCEWYMAVLASALQLLVKTLAISMMLIVLFISVTRWPRQAIDNEATRTNLLSMLFTLGLTMVALEDLVGVNKSSVMMVLAATMWTFLAVSYHPNRSKAGASILHHELNRGLEEVGSVILFLLPAMGLVESIDHFDGFAIVTLVIRKAIRGQKERLMPIICLLTFLLSSVIDNLTATILALKLLRRLAPGEEEWRRNCGASAVIAANAGGAWSPIGDVTTTMLWIQGKITPPKTVAWLLWPSFMAGAVPLLGIWWTSRERDGDPVQLQPSRTRQRPERRRFTEFHDEDPPDKTDHSCMEEEPLSQAAGEGLRKEVTVRNALALVLGISFILLVPLLKMWTGLPPYLGMLLALGLFWLITDSLGGARRRAHGEPTNGAEDHHSPGPEDGVVAALHKVDLTGLLFFTGVLLAVGALDSAGVLRDYATMLVRLCGPSPVALTTLLGISSAVVDNVPLVEAAIDMFREAGADEPLWQLVALAAGTGGSILSIGSIAGVTLMSMEGVGFLWYSRRISLWASAGFVAGIAAYQCERLLFG